MLFLTQGANGIKSAAALRLRSPAVMAASRIVLLLLGTFFFSFPVSRVRHNNYDRAWSAGISVTKKQQETKKLSALLVGDVYV